MRTLFLLITLLGLALGFTLEDFGTLKLLQDPDHHIIIKSPKTTADRIAGHGYPAETHQVVTEDGYIVTMFRIPYSHKLQNQNDYRPIVLIMHGLDSCSDGWVLNGPDDALPFVLADAGFDVFLGNARGTTYSRNHTSLSPKVPYFWDFSWHEIGHYDLPAMVDKALEVNGQDQEAIHYVGHSQGTTVLFVFLSTRPEYNSKIKMAHMLAPTAFMSHVRDPMIVKLSPVLGYQNIYSALFEKQEYVPSNELIRILGYNACEEKNILDGFCNSLAYLYEGSNAERSNMTAIRGFIGTHPGGSSTNQVRHYMQENQSGHFRQYDRGVKKNLKVYGQEAPPDYPVQLITAKIHLWYGDNDYYVGVEDVLQLADLLPNREMHHMEDPLWNHEDFSVNKEVRKYVNDPIANILWEYETLHRNHLEN